MTAATRNGLVGVIAAATFLSIGLWILVFAETKGNLLCLIATCDTSLTVTGELQVDESQPVLECELMLVAPAQTSGVHRRASEAHEVAYKKVGRAVEAEFSVTPWHDGYQISVVCPGYQQYVTSVFSNRELAARGWKLELGKVAIVKTLSGMNSERPPRR